MGNYKIRNRRPKDDSDEAMERRQVKRMIQNNIDSLEYQIVEIKGQIRILTDRQKEMRKEDEAK